MNVKNLVLGRTSTSHWVVNGGYGTDGERNHCYKNKWLSPASLPSLGCRVECVQVHIVFAYLTETLGHTAIAVPGGTAKELLPGFTNSGWEYKTDLFLEALLKIIQQTIILNRKVLFISASPLHTQKP